MLEPTKHDIRSHGEALSDIGIPIQDDEHLAMLKRLARTFGSPKDSARLSAYVDDEYRNERR